MSEGHEGVVVEEEDAAAGVSLTFEQAYEYFRELADAEFGACRVLRWCALVSGSMTTVRGPDGFRLLAGCLKVGFRKSADALERIGNAHAERAQELQSLVESGKVEAGDDAGAWFAAKGDV